MALLQEVPPWWPPELARSAGAQQRTALTSRNSLLPVRRRLAERWPDLLKSGGGGANAILARLPVGEHRVWRLTRLPERRVCQAVRLQDETVVANLHATAHRPDRARRDVSRARAHVLAWAGEGPAVLGGDLNLRDLRLEGFAHAAGNDVDHVFVRGLEPSAPGRVLAHDGLSDHAPVLATVGMTPPPGGS